MELAKERAITDLATQCVKEFNNHIPDTLPYCRAQSNSSGDTCQRACDIWSKKSVTLSVENFETLFSDETVGTKRCRMKVKFNVEYDGGQFVRANINYIIAPGDKYPQVALSE